MSDPISYTSFPGEVLKEYWIINYENQWGDWSTYTQGPTTIWEKYDDVAEYANKLKELHKIRIVHQTSEIVWES
jgi:hypothetical protein